MKKSHLLLILLIFLGFYIHNSSQAGLIDPNTPDTQYIEYARNFHYVGRIYGETLDNQKYFGSCVAINDSVIITAAHIATEIKTANVSINGNQIEIIEWIIHKDFHKDKLGLNDIAICLTKEKINLDWYPELYQDKNEINKICCLAGFGAYGTFGSGPIKSDGQRRAGSNIIDYTELGVLICNPSTDSKKTSLEFFICPGDSGGGLFIDNKLAGIHSYVIRFKPTNRQESAHTRISDHVDWINNNTNILINRGK